MSTSLDQIKKKKKVQKSSNSGRSISDILSIELTKKKLSDANKEEFYSELAMLLDAGLDIKTSFSILTIEKTSKKINEFYKQVNEKLITGFSLSEALDSTKLISPLEYYSLKVGEETGKIAEVLTEISEYFNQKIKWRKQIVGALSYPIMVIATALVVILFMVSFIVPLFEDVFKRFDAELPGVTKLVLSFSNWIKASYPILLLVIVSIVVLYLINRKKEWYRKFSSNALLKMPVLKEIILKVRMARYCNAMSKMISYYVPILTAIDLSAKMTNFYPLEKALEKIHSDISKGVLLSESMRQFKIFDNKMISLTKVGEEVNQIGKIYNKLAKQYADDFQYRIASINNVLEPALILIIGGLIALILISMYLPMFQLNNSFM